MGGSLSDLSDESADQADGCSYTLSVMVIDGADHDFDLHTPETR